MAFNYPIYSNPSIYFLNAPQQVCNHPCYHPNQYNLLPQFVSEGFFFKPIHMVVYQPVPIPFQRRGTNYYKNTLPTFSAHGTGSDYYKRPILPVVQLVPKKVDSSPLILAREQEHGENTSKDERSVSPTICKLVSEKIAISSPASTPTQVCENDTNRDDITKCLILFVRQQVADQFVNSRSNEQALEQVENHPPVPEPEQQEAKNTNEDQNLALSKLRPLVPKQVENKPLILATAQEQGDTSKDDHSVSQTVCKLVPEKVESSPVIQPKPDQVEDIPPISTPTRECEHNSKRDDLTNSLLLFVQQLVGDQFDSSRKNEQSLEQVENHLLIPPLTPRIEEDTSENELSVFPMVRQLTPEQLEIAFFNQLERDQVENNLVPALEQVDGDHNTEKTRPFLQTIRPSVPEQAEIDPPTHTLPLTVEEEPVQKKTILCKWFTEFGSCPMGVRCYFAHGKEELLPRKPQSCPEICRVHIRTRKCKFGDQCWYLHLDEFKGVFDDVTKESSQE